MFPPPARGSVICAFGELIQDQVVVLDDALPPEGQVDGQFSLHRGGCAPNVLATVASLSVPTRFLGHFGADSVSSSLADQLQRAGVRIFGVRRGRGATSLCIKLPGGETSLVFDPADSRSVTPADVRRWWLKDAAVLHLNSHHLFAEETAPAFWKLVELAHESNVPISLDASSANRLQAFGAARYREAVLRIRPAVFMANGPEGDVLGLDRHHLEGASVVIHHRGARPTVVSMGEGESWDVPVPECDDVVDTVAAGDVFAGGFLVGWLQGRSLRGAVELGHQVAVESVRNFGVEVPREKPTMLSEVS